MKNQWKKYLENNRIQYEMKNRNYEWMSEWINKKKQIGWYFGPKILTFDEWHIFIWTIEIINVEKNDSNIDRLEKTTVSEWEWIIIIISKWVLVQMKKINDCLPIEREREGIRQMTNEIYLCSFFPRPLNKTKKTKRNEKWQGQPSSWWW